MTPRLKTAIYNQKRFIRQALGWQQELKQVNGFDPVVIGGPINTEDPLTPGKQMQVDTLGIVTIHDGPSLSPGEIIAPAVGNGLNEENYHNNYQDPEAFSAPAGDEAGNMFPSLTALISLIAGLRR